MWRRARKFFRKHGWMAAAVSWAIHGVNAYFYVSVAVAAVIAWATTTWAWYWATLNYAGAAIAFLVSYIVLAFGSVLFGVGASMYSRRHVASPVQVVSGLGDLPGGALTWYSNLTIEGGPLTGRPVFSLQFPGGNNSRKEVRLTEAYLTSATDGDRLDLEIVAEGTNGQEIVPLDQVNLIPPGAPVRLIAKFNLPAGLDAAAFLAKWRRFYFNVTDSSGSTRNEYREEALAFAFPGMAGPRVTKKT